jgi:hypothetical protein
MPDPVNRLQDCPIDGACPPECRSVFNRVVVSYLIQGPAKVMWDLLETFTDPGPLRFQLQVGQTARNDSDDWVDVGIEVVDAYFALDDTQRSYGKTNYTHYRIVLTTSRGTYTSDPVGMMGVLDRRSWRIARDMVRQLRQAMRVGNRGQRGYLLKRRITGEDCPTCLDHMTREVRDPACPTCFGTGKKCGYYYPASCVWAEIGFKSRRTELDGGQSRGTVEDITVPALMIMTDMLTEDDVWVADKTDDRYYVHRVQHVEEIRGVPVSANVELRPVPFTSVIYTIEIPQQMLRHGVAE